MKLTKSEIALVEASLNYTDREGQLSDNYSNLYTSCCNPSEIKILSQMGKEGLVWFEDEETARDCGRGADDLVVYLTPKCINEYFDWKEAEAKDQEIDKLTKVMEIANLKSDIDKLTADYDLKLKETMDLLNEKLKEI